MNARLRSAAAVAAALSLAALAHAEPGPPIVVTGAVEGAYAFADRDVEHRIVGNLYLPRHDAFSLNAAMVRAERALPADRPGTGFVLQAMAGEHATPIRAAGLDLGDHADLVQAYGSLGFPHAGLVVSMGKMATVLGQEVIESVLNPHVSVGNQFVFVEDFTGLGLDAAWTGPAGWSARARVTNGWDVVTDNNTGRTLFGRVGCSDGVRSVALLGYTGRELPDSVGGHRSGLELIASVPVGAVRATVQLDVGRESALDARWRAAGVWLVLPLRTGIDVALRADVLEDRDGARTSGALGFPALEGQTLSSFTATLGIRTLPGAVIRPELRYDRSDHAVFAGAKEQWTAAVGLALLF